MVNKCWNKLSIKLPGTKAEYTCENNSVVRYSITVTFWSKAWIRLLLFSPKISVFGHETKCI